MRLRRILSCLGGASPVHQSALSIACVEGCVFECVGRSLEITLSSAFKKISEVSSIAMKPPTFSLFIFDSLSIVGGGNKRKSQYQSTELNSSLL